MAERWWLLFLVACETGTTELMFTCPEGTMRSGEECVTENDPRGACDPACAGDERCARGVCIPNALPDLNGYWRGQFRIYCRQAGFASSIDARVGWDIAQEGGALTVYEGEAVGTGEVREDGIRFGFRQIGNAFSYDVTLDGVVSYGGNRIEGRLTGTHGFRRESNGEVLDITCDVAPISYVRLIHQTRTPVTRERSDVSGVWHGLTNVYGVCPAPPPGVILGLENATTATITVFEGGLITAELETEDTYSTEDLEGRLEADGHLFFSRGKLAGKSISFIDEILIGANTDPPSNTGLDLVVSWDGLKLAGEFNGIITTKEQPPATCSISAGHLDLAR